MSNKIIGIPGYVYKEGSFGVGPNYLEWISQFGKPRIIMPWEDLAEVDALLFPGGADLNPNTYGQIPGFRTGNPDVHKQYFYDKKLSLYIDAKIPVFGICLGFQALNVFFGGSLKQNLIYHSSSSDRWQKGHTVKLLNDAGEIITYKDSKKGVIPLELAVNSHHHQGVLLDGISEQFKTLAIEDSVDEEVVVEAFKHIELKVAGVQWHPEEFYDDYSKDLFQSILD